MSRLVQLVNGLPAAAVDGGTSREAALFRCLEEQGADALFVCDEGFSASRAGKLRRPSRLIREIRERRPDLLVLSYPSYPFYWQHKVTPYFGMSVLFAAMLSRLRDRQGFRLAVDVRDLPAYQADDLGFRLEMPASVLRRYDSFIFRRADRLWMCSESLAELARSHYRLRPEQIVLALNGYTIERDGAPAPEQGPLRFAYAGSLNSARDIEQLLQSFAAAGASAELHLCGSGGEWIAGACDAPGVFYHGSLTDDEAADLVSTCHVGVIPYPERGYYNLAYATKLSFYLGLGLPVLCSEAREIARHVRRLQVGVCVPGSNFAAAIADLADNREQLRQWQDTVRRVRGAFRWSEIYRRAVEQSTAAPDRHKEAAGSEL